MIRHVTKSNGKKEEFNPEKLRKWSEFADNSSRKVSWSEIELEAVKRGYDGMPTRELHNAMIAACVDKRTQAYSDMAARLLLGRIYKQAHGGFNKIPTLVNFYRDAVSRKLWLKMDYTENELTEIGKIVKHNKNLTYGYSVLRQMEDKYLVKDAVKGVVHESPQFLFIGLAMAVMEKQPKDRRIADIKKLYQYTSDLKINLPSPYLTTTRTNIPGSASCCLFRADDTAQSQRIANTIAHEYTLNNAGIGVNISTRATGQGVKSNRIVHGGMLPYLRWMESSVGASKQACYSQDTEILTQRGFIKFSDLKESDLVSQVYGDGSSEFIKPKAIFEYDYKGGMVSFKSDRNVGVDLLVTPNHRMAYLKSVYSTNESLVKERESTKWHKIDSCYQAEPSFFFKEADKFEPKRNTCLMFSSSLKGDCELTDWERLNIAFQADGYSKPVRKDYVYAFHFNEQRKIDRLLSITKSLGLDTEVVAAEQYTTIRVNAGREMCKDFSGVTLEGKSSKWAEDFLREVVNWDGSLLNDTNKDVATLQSTSEDVISFFQAVSCLCGAYSHMSTSQDKRQETKRLPVFRLYVSFDRKYTTGRAVNKRIEDYQGKVYCVEVETGAVVVRRNGMTAVCGNSRGGSATVTFSCLEPDFEDLIRLKNPTTVNSKRVDKLDYSVVVNNAFLRRAAQGKSWMLVSVDEAPELYEAMYKSEEEFEAVFDAVSRRHIKKKVVQARDMLQEIIRQRAETGRIYIFYADNANRHTPFKDTIFQSNLCVAPETKILTSKGYLEISTLEGKEVDVWNGEEWSSVLVRKTGEGQKLIKVVTSEGKTLECTEHHKFYLQQNYHGNPVEVRAKDLKSGDKLIKFSLPVIEGAASLDKAYINGFYSGDGCNTKQGQRVYLYHEKRNLAVMFEGGSQWYYNEETNRQYKHYHDLQEKFYVPSANILVKDRLDWLAGYLDADGCVYRNKDNEQLTASSNNRDFLSNVQMMLQTLGANAKIIRHMPAGSYKLPANNGTGDYKDYQCKEAYRLLINSNDTQSLLKMGLNLKRLSVKVREPQRSAAQFNTIISVSDEGRISDTYCFTEAKRHMGMFNGLLTGQCQEIFLPTKAFQKMSDLDTGENLDESELALCFLSSLVAGRIKPEEYEDVAYYTVLTIDNIIESMEYPFYHNELTAKARRSIGVGITNLAHYLAASGTNYSEEKGKVLMHELAERHYYWLARASLRLGKEKGNAEWMHKTKWPEGWLPIDTYASAVDNIADFKLQFDWEELRGEIIANGGIRNSVLTAVAPNESSSLVSNTTNSLYPVRDTMVFKQSQKGNVLFIVPEYDKLKDKYQIAWDVSDRDIAEMYGIFSKFGDQGISCDKWVDYTKSEDGKLSTKAEMQFVLTCAKLGVKSLYYMNSRTKSSSTMAQQDAVLETPSLEEEQGCESCSM